jgi:DNA end-binding protein Ku
MNGALTMATMRFHDEVVSPDDLDDVLPEKAEKIEKRELDMAKQLIESLSTDFEPDRYEDEYRDKLLALIERKAKGEDIVAAPTEQPKPTKAPDLMAALEESLAAVSGEELASGSGSKSKSKSTSSKSTAKKSGGSGGSSRKSKAKAKTKAKA